MKFKVKDEMLIPKHHSKESLILNLCVQSQSIQSEGEGFVFLEGIGLMKQDIFACAIAEFVEALATPEEEREMSGLEILACNFLLRSSTIS